MLTVTNTPYGFALKYSYNAVPDTYLDGLTLDLLLDVIAADYPNELVTSEAGEVISALIAIRGGFSLQYACWYGILRACLLYSLLQSCRWCYTRRYSLIERFEDV